MQDYTIEKSIDGSEISRDNCRKLGFIINVGLCRANPYSPLENRTINFYYKHTLKPLIERGIISDGSNSPFDDRKMRYHKADFRSGLSTISELGLSIYLGHSNFLEYLEKKERGKKTTETLTKMGKVFYSDPYAFFPRNPGVTGIFLTFDKKLIVGERQVGEKDRYEGLLQGVAGHLTYKSDSKEVNLEEEMLRETIEEVGIPKSKVNRLEFLGLYSDPSVARDDLDFCYLINTNIHSDYFKSGKWKENVKVPEHKKFLLINNYNKLNNLVRTGNLDGKNWDIIFSTRGALASLKEKDFD